MMQSALLDRWLTKQFRHDSQFSLRLFCFPYAGGSAQLFSDWSKDLPETVEVCPIELPGHGTRLSEPPFTQLLPLVEAIATVIHPLLVHKPFAFFGHSLGALISFEISRLLVSEYGLCPSCLYVSGRAAPHLPKSNPIHNLPEPLFLDQLRYLNGTPEEILQNTELMQLFVPTLRADFALNDTYTYTEAPPLKCPIAVFGGLQDLEYEYEQLEA
jgi:medium-chain acyl-[acyl-carrier-protein] hydrolase